MVNIHATLVSYHNKGILFIGPSGSGKSDLALRMIMEKKALLVADDRVILENIDGHLWGKAPDELKDKLEVRGLGISEMTSQHKVEILLCAELCDNRTMIERIPKPEFIDFLGISVVKIKLYPFDCSTICKIVLKADSLVA